MPERRMHLGAEAFTGKGVHFRVWAPSRRQVDLVITGGPGSGPNHDSVIVPLISESAGLFWRHVPEAAVGTLYRFRLDEEAGSYPDPVSRFQPHGPHESSMVIDPDQFKWTDDVWQGIRLKGQVVYEMHIGTFTPEGTWASAERVLEELAAIGITVLELMPVFEFPGKFGWGYDGVDMFAPTHLYGTPDDFRSFVNRAHAVGLGVILDVVYNHLGPDGNYIEQFCNFFFTKKYNNEWGQPINFDGADAAPIREFFIANACYWIREFHLDGFRFDATQQIYDHSTEHILKTLCREVRKTALNRSLLLVAENETQRTELVRPAESGGYCMDALWNDDFHHSAVAAATGRKEAYYADYNGDPQEFISAAKRGFLYQGQYYSWQKKRRGTPTTGIGPESFVFFIENHDQISNSIKGRRFHQNTSPGVYRAMMGLLLLLPGTPMLFQGQEFGSTSPFLYFADMPAGLSALIRSGRAEFLAQFPSIATPEGLSRLDDPADPMTFARCKLNPEDRRNQSPENELCRDLLRLRREDPAFRAQGEFGFDGAVLAPQAFVLRYFMPDAADHLVIVNFGTQQHREYIPEPLVAPPAGRSWRVLWSSEDVRYGGNGIPPVEVDGRWEIPGQATIALIGDPASQ